AREISAVEEVHHALGRAIRLDRQLTYPELRLTARRRVHRAERNGIRLTWRRSFANLGAVHPEAGPVGSSDDVETLGVRVEFAGVVLVGTADVGHDSVLDAISAYLGDRRPGRLKENAGARGFQGAKLGVEADFPDGRFGKT